MIDHCSIFLKILDLEPELHILDYSMESLFGLVYLKRDLKSLNGEDK